MSLHYLFDFPQSVYRGERCRSVQKQWQKKQVQQKAGNLIMTSPEKLTDPVTF